VVVTMAAPLPMSARLVSRSIIPDSGLLDRSNLHSWPPNLSKDWVGSSQSSSKECKYGCTETMDIHGSKRVILIIRVIIG
jgi:hypothetical protein